MDSFIVLVVAGFAAAFVDGSLGMGFGPTSSTLLLGAGLSPTAVSSTVNLAKVATGAAGAGAHWRAGNVDRRLVLRLALPGVAGTVVGVTLLANVDTEVLRPMLAVLLLGLAVRILLRASRPIGAASSGAVRPPRTDRVVTAAATVGGVTNGMVGSWGPVVTPVVMGRPGVEPRMAIGSVNTAEVIVASAASGSILVALGSGGLDVSVLVALMIGGVLAAPVAAWTVGRVSARGLAIGVGAILAITNARELAAWADVGPERWYAYAAVIVLAGATAARPRLDSRLAMSPATGAATPRDHESRPVPVRGVHR